LGSVNWYLNILIVYGRVKQQMDKTTENRESEEVGSKVDNRLGLLSNAKLHVYYPIEKPPKTNCGRRDPLGR
jgi:hypothetical protein